jgi:hypothetical protein
MNVGRRRRRGAARLRAVIGAGLFTAAAAVSMTACAATRNELGLNDGLCYVALPAANAAVHGRGSLIGLRLRKVSDLRVVHQLMPLPTPRGHRLNSGTRLCLVAFRGAFAAREVHRARGREAGRVAVVVLTYPGNRVLGTVILDRPPLPFGHPHLEV